MLDEIGRGRFGRVYCGQDDAASPLVAVRAFEQGLSPEQANALVEALTTLCDAPLDHASIVAPVAAGVEGNIAWLAEPYVDGTPLDVLLDSRGPQPLADVLLCITQVAGALDFAAAVGVFHGALHPRDVLLAGDRTLLTGLGVVQALMDAGLDVPMSAPGVSPQRAAGQPVTPADDVFALAVVTFQVLYGRPLTEHDALPSQVTPLTGVDHMRLRDVLARGLSDDPGARPSSALELAGALQSVLVENRGAAVATEAPVPPSRAPMGDVPVARELPHVVDEPIVRRPAPPVTDLPLRMTMAQTAANATPRPPVSPDRDGRPVFATTAPARAASRDGQGRWLWMAAGLALGILGGFAGGFLVGQRDVTPAPITVQPPVSRSGPAPIPAPTSGQDYTDSAVAPTRVDEADVKPTEPAPPAPEATRRASEAAPPTAHSTAPAVPTRPALREEQFGRPAPSVGPGSIEVVSRPPGAQVYVDGRLVGRTPLVLSDMRPGQYSVRIALPEHRRWVTTVDVMPGERARVAASLEK